MVAEAHQATLHWVFDKQENQPWVDFPSWLRSSEQLYWITGKAGSGKSTLMKFLTQPVRDISDPGEGGDEANQLRCTEHLCHWAGKKPLIIAHEFLASHPEIVHDSRESDGLLFEAYTLLLNGGHEARTLAQQYTHQALLLQYCHLLGRDGVSLFFKRMATPGHQAHEAFEKDLAQTFQRIVDMAKRDAKKRRDGAETERMVERVQLCSLVDGEASARIVIPPAESDDEEVRKARAIFESFAPEMRAALETGSLDEVNKVLGEMETSEAEELASLLAESGCMSIEGEVIDATTEDGKKTLEELKSASGVGKEKLHEPSRSWTA
ncbi:hypothetical protein CHGG_10526 [Chaetomium globosum CBS 148.51]|uniref:Uncharacterized protein n=1 Tax=Chaetomium globosum (strain ATCC 6205 / CBS 148.51 / DSM 1962 / NBRC 6347 / NRRL 1970) TaxID=306901 RepID=Q2GNC8_CHAGB|nr:uncharacterized protein CHGG_10526 [Chaetomium globosum CBS 148.51]EAQ84122.1 hypothetical protein CHGG_10526 [Chaetomium globosum CBS 148.51]